MPFNGTPRASLRFGKRLAGIKLARSEKRALFRGLKAAHGPGRRDLHGERSRELIRTHVAKAPERLASSRKYNGSTRPCTSARLPLPPLSEGERHAFASNAFVSRRRILNKKIKKKKRRRQRIV